MYHFLKTNFRIGDSQERHGAVGAQSAWALPAPVAAVDDAAAAILEADGYAGVGEDLDELLTMPDVACDDPAEEIVEDRTLRVRSKSKRQLILEAASAKHQRSHYPHNPFCEICCRAHMRQHSMHCKRERGDDELPPVTAPHAADVGRSRHQSAERFF